MSTKKKDTTDYVLLDAADLSMSMRSIAPEKLTLIKNPDHFLYDVRVHRKPVDHIVDGIMEFGLDGVVKAAILPAPTGDKDKRILAVYDGRQSVINSVEANKRMTSVGGEPIKVAIKIREASETDLMRLGVITNEHVQMDDVVTKGEKAQALLDRGVSMEQVCLDFGGVTEQSVGNWTSLLQLDSRVKEMVRTGKLTMVRAIRMLKMSKADQYKTAKAILDGRPLPTRTKKGAKPPKRKNQGVDKRRVKRIHELGAHKKTKNKVVQLIIGWYVGEVSDKDVAHLIDFEAVEKDRREKKAASKKKTASKKKASAKKKTASKKKASAKKKAPAKKKTKKKPSGAVSRKAPAKKKATRSSGKKKATPKKQTAAAK